MMIAAIIPVSCSKKEKTEQNKNLVSLEIRLSVELSSQKVKQMLEQASARILEKNNFVVSEKRQPLHILIRISGRKNGSDGTCLVDASLDALEPVPGRASVAGTGTLSNERDLPELARETVTEAMQMLVFQYRLSTAGADELIRALGHPEADVQIFALRVLSERREKSAVDAVIGLLSDPRKEVADSAVGVLAQIGDQRAVEPLIQSVVPHETDSLLRIIDALARIGGPGARSYLEMLAGGHELRQIRMAAARARAAMDSQERPEQAH